MARFLILLALLASPLWAHEATVFCNIKLTGASDHAGIKVSVEADPLWGHPDAESLAAAEEAKGKFAKLVISGEGETDKTGALRLKVEFSFEGEGVRPTRSVWRDKQQIEAEYCHARLTARREGFRPYIGTVMLTAGDESQSVFANLNQVVTVRGSVINLSDRKPVPELELQLSTTVQTRRVIPRPDGRDGRGGRGGWGGPQYEYVQEGRSWTLKTDAQGAFMLSDETLPSGNYSLTPLGGKLAFSATSKAARGIGLRDGDNDLGALIVVPGGSLKFRVVNSEDDTPVSANCTLQGNNYWRNLALVDGAGELSGIVEGEFTLHVRQNAFWETQHKVSIQAGELTDLGDLKLDPHISLDVIALSDGSTGIETYSVTTRMLDGEFPPNSERRFERSANLTAEHTTITGLRRGKWLVIVQAQSHARTEVEVELPVTEPLTVTLSEGGVLQVSVRLDANNRMDNFQLYAVRCDSTYYKTLSALKPEEWLNMRIDTSRGGVYAPERNWSEVRQIEALAPGAYLVLAFAGHLGWLKQDNVEIEKGKTTSLELAPEPPTMAVTVTRDGKPAADVKLYFMTSGWNQTSEVVEATTGKDGACVHEFKTMGQAYVLTERELEYVGRPNGQDWEWGENLRRFKGDGTVLRYGQRVEQAIELHDRNAIWVTLKIKLPEGLGIDQPVLRPKIAPTRGWSQYQGKQVADGLLFPRVPAGDYLVVTSVRTSQHQRIELIREIKVDTPPEQSFEVEFEIKSFTVALELPQDAEPGMTTVKLIPRAQLENFDAPFPQHEGRPDATGKVAFVGLEGGEYLVVATTWDHQGGLLACGQQLVDTSAAQEGKLKMNQDFGTLELRVEGNPALGGQQHSNWRVQFFDTMEEEVLPVDPTFAFGQVNSVAGVDDWRGRRGNQGVRGVPTGKYKVVVSAYGLQPVIEDGVEIKRGQTTRLTVTPSAAALLKLTLENIDARSLVQLKAKSAYLDASGKEVNVIAPGKRLFNLMESREQGGCEAWLLNLTPEVAKVVITIEGHEDIVIPVKAEPGKTILHTASAKPKTE